ncbi:MAG: beta-ketoacyl-ACP synthase II [Phycisphaerae bacterium]
MGGRRVVVTGMGAVTPLGVSAERFWDGLIEGRSGIGPIARIDVADFAARIGGECRDFVATDHIDRKRIKRLDRFAQFAIVACTEAFQAAGLDMNREDPRRVAVIYGSGIGGLNEIEEQHTRLMRKGPAKVSAFTIPRLMINAASGNISIAFGAKGISTAVSTACSSATHAMGQALETIRLGLADVVFTGGSEAAITPLGLAAFASMKALSTRNEDPTRASRPFDRDRDGFVMGEGAGTLIFEELEHARRRGAPMLAEVIGFGATSDATHIAQPSEDGAGAAAALQLALDDAGTNADDVDYINAHATSTPLGDVAETVAIKQVLGPHAYRVAISSTKGAIGHLLGASGGVELIAAIRAIQNAVIPPTINLDNPGDGCDLDYCANTARDRPCRTAISNSFGFGGHNACIVVRRID